jgi:hypothetical protein
MRPGCPRTSRSVWTDVIGGDPMRKKRVKNHEVEEVEEV